MSSPPKTSLVHVDILQDGQPLQHSLGICITSTQEGVPDAACTQQQHRMVDSVDGGPAGNSGSCDTESGSSFSDDETADEDERDGTPDVACYKHFVSEVKPSSPLNGYIK